MFKGFYNLTSGMLTQGKKLDVISNNMTNVATSGFKTDRFMMSTFDQVMWDRVGNTDKAYSQIGEMSYITAPDELVTDYSQASFDQTDLPLDFAIEGDGFFAIEDADGNRAYTRAGNFSLDDEGYLCLPGEGRVLDVSEEPIQLITDKITADSTGSLYLKDSGGYMGQIGVFAFQDNAQLAKNARGLFDANGNQATAAQVTIHHGMVEHSNVDLVQQMVEMISSQRAYQSAAQAAKIYDQLISKATTDVGRLS